MKTKYFAVFIMSLIITMSISVCFLAFLYIIVPSEQTINGRVEQEIQKLKYDCKNEIQSYLLTN